MVVVVVVAAGGWGVEKEVCKGAERDDVEEEDEDVVRARGRTGVVFVPARDADEYEEDEEDGCSRVERAVSLPQWLLLLLLVLVLVLVLVNKEGTRRAAVGRSEFCDAMRCDVRGGVLSGSASIILVLLHYPALSCPVLSLSSRTRRAIRHDSVRSTMQRAKKRKGRKQQ